MVINAVKELNTIISAQDEKIKMLDVNNETKDDVINRMKTQLNVNTAVMKELEAILKASDNR